jgi:DNA-binding beta-propeller fold protein YncE
MRRRALTITAFFAVALLSRSHPAGSPSGGDLAPVRTLRDPYPTFNGIAIDTMNSVVVASDSNLKSVLVYDRATKKRLRQISGERTEIGFVAGIAVDPLSREIFAVNNDIEDSLNVFPYGVSGNMKPVRRLAVPHQSWGIALSPARDALAVSVEVLNAVMIYRREADRVQPPLRVIRGAQTELADPHGVYWDGLHQEIAVANHGNFRGLARNVGAGCMAASGNDASRPGESRPPSITIYPASSNGDVRPVRKIEGPRTRLDWPMGIAFDPVRDEIVVANNGDSSVLIFGHGDNGDVAPRRVIRGTRTGIDHPMGIAIDAEHGGFWVANFGGHSAVFFSATADGDTAPLEVIRNAPAGTPTNGFGNPMALGYDARRKEVLVPN